MHCIRSKSLTSLISKCNKTALTSSTNSYTNIISSYAAISQCHAYHSMDQKNRISNYCADECNSKSLINSNNHGMSKRSPMVMSVRYRGSLNIKRAFVPDKTRAVVLDLVRDKYKFRLEGLPPSETCIEAVKKSHVPEDQENPFERILSREFLEKVEEGQMLIVMHAHPCTSEDLFEMRVQIHRSNMTYLFHNNDIVKMAFTGTKYENLSHVYCSSCATIVCYDTDIKKLLKLERRLPYFTILAGVVNDRIMTVNDLRAAAELPDMDTMRATLLSTLSMQSQRLSQALEYHQTELSGTLGRYSAAESKDSTTDGNTPA